MREIRPSGSEGGVALTALSLPLSHSHCVVDLSDRDGFGRTVRFLAAEHLARHVQPELLHRGLLLLKLAILLQLVRSEDLFSAVEHAYARSQIGCMETSSCRPPARWRTT